MIKEFVHQFCLAARDTGIEKLNFYMEERLTRDISVYEDTLEHLERSEVRQLFIEGLVDGKAGSVFVENMDPCLIPDYIEAIRETAAVCCNPFVPYELEGLQQRPLLEYNYTDLDSTVAAMCAAGRTARAYDPRISDGVQVHVKETGKRFTLADEKERYATDVVLGGSAAIYLVARDGELVQPGGKGKPFNTEILPNLNELARQAAEGAVSRLGAGSYASGNFRVVLDARVVAELLDAFMPAFFAGNINSRMSVLAGRLGQQLTGENISILEDPYMYGGFCTRNFDDEGVPTLRKAIVDKGKLNCWLHNRASAREMGSASGGNGFKTKFNEAVSTGYTNVYIPGGEYTRDELISMMDNGLLITGVSGVFAGARSNSGDFSLISTGYRVENGQRGKAVNQITIAGNFFDMLKEVLAIGSDEYWMIAPNGNVRTPSLYVKSLAISGKE